MSKSDFRAFLLRVAIFSLTVGGSSTLTGCGALLKSIRYSLLETKTEMTESIFMDQKTDLPPTLYLVETSTSAKDVTVRSILEQVLPNSGYTLVDNPKHATYVLQINHVALVKVELKDGETLADLIDGAVAVGYAGAFLAALANADEEGIVVVGLAAAAGSFLLDANTQHIAHTLTTDFELTETVVGPGEDLGLRYHRSRIVSGASKVNLHLEEALPVLQREMATALSRLLPPRPGNG